MLSNSQSSRFLALSKSSSSIELRQLNTPTRQVTVHHRGHPVYRPDTDGQKRLHTYLVPTKAMTEPKKTKSKKTGAKSPHNQFS